MITVGIVAHQSRTAQAHHLAQHVEADHVSVDDGTLGCDDNHDLVLSTLAAEKSQWTVILEDDALPVIDFRDQIRQALTVAPTPLVSFYLGRQRPPWAQTAAQTATSEAEGTGADWIVSSHLLHAVGYAICTPLIPSLLHFITCLPVDQHITAWAQAHGHLTAYTYPSLVDHRDQPTIFNHPDNQPRTPGRVAYRCAPHPAWSSQTVSMPI